MEITSDRIKIESLKIYLLKKNLAQLIRLFYPKQFFKGANQG